MFIKPWLAPIVLAASALTLALPASAARVALSVGIAPPPPQTMEMPAARMGHHWVPGYWHWQGNRHVWRQGVWLADRPGNAYHDPRWVERDGRWHFEPGGWARRDKDGDGVPNRVDNHPANPTRP